MVRKRRSNEEEWDAQVKAGKRQTRADMVSTGYPLLEDNPIEYGKLRPYIVATLQDMENAGHSIRAQYCRDELTKNDRKHGYTEES